MDFRKVENIFIAAFLILNIYLIFSYFNRNTLQYASTSMNQVDVAEVMEQNGIDLPEFENNHPTVYSMQADQNNLLEEEVSNLDEQAGTVSEEGTFYNSFLSDPVELEGNIQDGYTEEDRTTIENFVNSDRVLFGEDYEYGYFDEENSRFVFFQNVSGIPVADGTSEISLYINSQGNIYSYQQTFAGPMTEQGDPLEVITDQEAVETLFQNNEISSNTTVSKPRLSYQRTLNLEDLSMYSPVWIIHVETANGIEVHRVNGRDGQILPEITNTPAESNEDRPSEESSE